MGRTDINEKGEIFLNFRRALLKENSVQTISSVILTKRIINAMLVEN